MKKDIMRVIISGGRTFEDYIFLKDMMNEILRPYIDHYDIEIITGYAVGVDRLGDKYAMLNGYTSHVIPALWNKYGEDAGHIRNTEMGDFAKRATRSMLVAFWNGKSAGTKDMIDYAEKIGIPVKIVDVEYKKRDFDIPECEKVG